MLCRNTYDRDYIAQSRDKIAAQLAAYKRVAATSDPAAVVDFEPLFLNNLVVVLDNLFVHRTRAIEGKDGNPCNEVRVLCNSVMQNGCVLEVEKSIKWNPAKSVLKLAPGDKIALSVAAFEELASAYFVDIEAKFGA